MSPAEVTTQTASILVTDLVGSTEQRARLGEERAEALRREHDRLLAEAIARHGGTAVKSMGDGVLAMFPGAAEALAAAVDIQQAAHAHTRRKPDEPLVLRAGLSAGDVTVEDGDCFGTPVIQAARLCAAADGGQILAAEVVRWLAGGRGDHRFEAVGALELKGLSEPVPTVAVGWEPSIDVSGVPLPTVFSTPQTFAFAGRDDAWQVLKSAWATTCHGEGQVVLLAGEPGIGKTRLAGELARVVAEGGGIVLYGGCDEEVDLPYRPFSHALGHLARHADADVLEAHVTAHGGALGPVVALLERADATRPVADPEQERLRLFDAAVDLLARAAARMPVLLVLDDLHWADGSTLRMLRYVVRERATRPVMVLGTYRDTDVDRGHPLSSVLGELRREPGVERLALDGLDAAAISDVLVRTAGHDLVDIDSLAALLQSETDGNPFFVGEVMRHLVESGAVVQSDGRWSADRGLIEALGVPEGVRDVIGRRLSALPPELSDALRVAAVIGHEFDAPTVASVSGIDIVDVLDHLDTATQRGLLEASGRRWRFAHALVRQTLAEELSLGKRLRMHHQVAVALEASGGELLAIAHHHCEAAVVGDADTAVALARRAGEEAMAALAWEQAIRWFERALEAEENLTPDARRRAELHLAAGEAHNAVDPRGGLVHFSAAGDLGIELGDGEIVGRAAIGYGGGETAIWLGPDDPRGVALLEAAEALLPPEDSALRARLLTTRCGWLTYTPDAELRAASAEAALAMARRSGDSSVLARALWSAGQALRGEPRPDAMEAIGREGIDRATPSGDVFSAAEGWYNVAFAHAVRGDLDGVAAAAHQILAIAEPARFQLALWEGRALLAFVAAMRGEPEAPELIELARLTGSVIGQTGELVASLQAQALRALVSGDDLALLTAYEQIALRHPSLMAGTGDAAAAVRAAHEGRDDASVMAIELAAAIATQPAAFQSPYAAMLARAVRRLGDGGLAAVLRPYIEPWSGLMLTGAAESADVAGDHLLAWLDVAEGRASAAIANLRAALDLYERGGMLLTRWATVELVELLMEGGELDEARALADGVRPLLIGDQWSHLAGRLATALA
ncbi:MAG TPA: AAA family ATPase [Acidimicrobiales bacterium]|nr:AAA family ATPase [Acidimicrobiales bacterium]